MQTNSSKYVLIGPQISYPAVADRESIAFHTAPFRSRTDRAADDATAVGRVEDPCARRTSATGNDPEVRAEEREAQRSAAAVPATVSWRQRRGRRSGEHPRAAAACLPGNGKEPDARQASGTTGTAGSSAACGTGGCLHA